MLQVRALLVHRMRGDPHSPLVNLRKQGLNCACRFVFSSPTAGSVSRAGGAARSPDAHCRAFRRDDAALLIDGHHRRLASQEARGRPVLDDYARERLGVSGRTLESAAAVAKALATLPALTRAFEAGVITWAHLRLLVCVAVPETEAEWPDLARGRTVRALEALIRPRSRRPRRPAPGRRPRATADRLAARPPAPHLPRPAALRADALPVGRGTSASGSASRSERPGRSSPLSG